MIWLALVQVITMAEATILGLGNLLWADEGFGVRAAEKLFEQYADNEKVDVVDGGGRSKLALLPRCNKPKTVNHGCYRFWYGAVRWRCFVMNKSSRLSDGENSVYIRPVF